jgi:hypothetical protein
VRYPLSTSRRMFLDLTTGDLVKQVENPGFAGWVADTDWFWARA